ncbi:12049_t:CDS:2 [Entrophospora sp. SA101]|nr:12049_t:CDS:2 [Entrophospora sp. SA101]
MFLRLRLLRPLHCLLDAEPSSLVATTKIIISLVSSYKYDISPILDELPEDSKIRRFGEGFGTGKGRPNKGFNAETSRCKGRKIRTNKGFNAETSRCKGKKNTKNQNYQIVLRILRMISNTALNFFYDQKGCTRLQDKTTSFRDPTDSVLMKLVQDAKFVSYLKQICLANNSRYKDVEKCMGGLYHTVSKQLHGHDKDIEIDARDWSVNEVLTLGALFHYYNIPYYYDEEGQLTEYLYILQNSSCYDPLRPYPVINGLPVVTGC